MLELHTPQQAAQWLRARVTGALQTDSRKVCAGDGFIAWPGAATDARRFVAGALASGATAVLVESQGAQTYAFAAEEVAAYAHLKAAAGLIAAEYFEQPSEQLQLVAITGTNGKTSTAWWLAQALSNLKLHAPVPCAMVGTLGVGMLPAPALGQSAADRLVNVMATGLTTPDPVLLQQSLRAFVDQGVKACALEASSIGIEESRLDGTRIHTAVFTNFTQDHLDYHGSMQAYWQSKLQLFQWPGLQAAVVNVDDLQGAELAASLDAARLDVWTLSCSGPARLRACDITHDAQGMCFTVVEGNARHLLRTHVIGAYNVANLLGVVAAMRSLGVPLAAAIASCHDLTPVPGRMEWVELAGQPLAAVDYAHTPDALAKALLALQPLARERGGQLWCVFGCGGDRDSGKRPLMGAVAARYADRVLVTSDNPRSEKPEIIISQILLGLSGHGDITVQPDRAQAIAQAMDLAAPNDVLLFAGKGHEDYQEVAGQRLPFSDVEQVRLALERRAAHAAGPKDLK